MTHLLDTNSCIELLRRGRASSVARRLTAAPPGSVGLCSVVVGELLYGAHRSRNTAAPAQVRAFCSAFASLAFDDRAAEEYGRTRADLSNRGLPIGPNDLMIASIALAHGIIVVTRNTTEFGRVAGLVIEDWQTGP